MSANYDNYYEFRENFRYAKNYWGTQVNNSRIYARMAAGQSWTDEELRELAKENREPVNLNIVRRPMQFFSGYLRDNLNSNVITAVEGSDPKTADQLTKTIDRVWDKGNFYNCLLNSADEAGKVGIALAGLEVDYSTDFVTGDLVGYTRTNNSFYLDPLFERIDLKDCGFGITRDLISRNNVERLLSYIGDNLEQEIPIGFENDTFFSFSDEYETLYKDRNIVAYDQYYRKNSRKRKYLVDMESGFHRDITDLDSEQIDRLKVGINRMQKLREEAKLFGQDLTEFPVLEIKTMDRSFVELNVFLNGIQFYQGIDKTGIDETYPFVPLLCYFEPSIVDPNLRVQGFPAALYSDQRQFNKRHMKIVGMMDNEISTGFAYLIGSVPDPTDLQQTGQNKIIGVDPESPEGLNSIRELKGGGANPALFEYQKVLDDLSLTLLNVNESILGIDQDSKTIISGRLAQVRIAQGLRINRKYFDQIEESQKVYADLTLKAIQNLYTPQKIQRMIGEEPTEQFYSREFEEYQVIIKQGLRTQSQRDAFYSELVNLKREGIIDVAPDFLISQIGITGISELEEYLKAQREQQQVQQEKIDMQERMDLELANATKEEKLGLAIERRTRAEANEGLQEERISEATENRAQAALARAKTISEIADMEDQRLFRVIEFVNRLEQIEKKEQEDKLDDSTLKTDILSAEVENEVEQMPQENSNTINPQNEGGLDA